MNRRLERKDLDDYIALMKDELGIEVVEKTTSRFMRFLAKLLFFNKKFLNGYITTIGKYIYWPNMEWSLGDNPENDFAVLFHEGQHREDSVKLPVLYEIAYIAPQAFAIFCLLAFLAIPFNPLWVLAVLLVVLATPLPSPGRTEIEMRATGCGIAFNVWYLGSVGQSTLDRYTRMFTTAKYYFMCPSKSYCMKRFAKMEKKIRSGELTKWQRTTYAFLEGRGIVSGG
jgi:hypothetical protein